MEAGNDHFLANALPAENDMSGSIPSTKDPLDLFGPTTSNNSGQSQKDVHHDPLGVFDSEPEHSSHLLNPNPGVHESFTPPSAKSENLIPDDWDLTHFPNRSENNTSNDHAENSQISPEPLSPKKFEDTGEFPQTPESLFGDLPENWGQPQPGLVADFNFS
jgi:hypothetical protein